MADTVFSRGTWLPSVLRVADGLLLHVVGGADALHDPRAFTVALRSEHLLALQDSLRRHLLLYGAMLPLCDAAGTREPWDGAAAGALLDPVLLGTPREVDDALRRTRVDRRALIAHHGALRSLDRHSYFEAMQSGTAEADWARVRRYAGP